MLPRFLVFGDRTCADDHTDRETGYCIESMHAISALRGILQV
jgi:hypothetical protein